ncbi:MAG: hypothetical protein AAGM12_11990 [Pseudomonadota bacterium]
MHLPSLDALDGIAPKSLSPGPIALVIAEDQTEVASTISHLVGLGFAKVIVLAPPASMTQEDLAQVADDAILVDHPTRQPGTLTRALGIVIKKAPETWLHYCFNGEYLFFPFCESRSVSEMIAFIEEERRSSVLTYVIDLYANDLGHSPDGVCLETAHLDGSGYYAETRRAPDGTVLERQLNFYGGLRWRFEEHVAPQKRKIDRVGLFKTGSGLEFRDNHTLSDEELNTYTCPWHHSLTASICSFRVAKALRLNPGSRHDVPSFLWHRSEPFTWNSQQLMDLGLMEPGQWF